MTERIYQEVRSRVGRVAAQRDGNDEELRDQVPKDGGSGVKIVGKLIGKYDELVKENMELREQCKVIKEERKVTFHDLSTGQDYTGEELLESYNAHVKAHNALVQEFNTLVESHQNLLHDCEALEEECNDCGQEHGEALGEEHNDAGEEYDDTVQTYEESIAEEEDSSEALRAAESKYESLSREYNDLLQKKDDCEKALEVGESKYEELSRGYNQLLRTHGHLSLEHERDTKALRAAEFSNRKHRDHIEEMGADLLRLKIKWRTYASPV